jgi:oligopeptide/dipeptide ABC transporter ATP-binding protein
VEQGDVRQVFRQPAHPYTEALLASVPKMEEKVELLAAIDGQPPPLDALPEGCRFAPRCAYAESRCTTSYPPVFTVAPEHTAACWRLENA